MQLEKEFKFTILSKVYHDYSIVTLTEPLTVIIESCESPLRNMLSMIREMKSLIFFGVNNHNVTSFNMNLQL